MGYFILLLIVLVLILLLVHAFLEANPGRLAQGVRRGSGVGLLAAAAGLAAFGRWALAGIAATFGMSLLGRRGGVFDFGQRSSPRAGQRSNVRTGWLEMTLEHDTGDMQGRVLRGPYAGRELANMELEELLDFLSELDDQESRQLLEAYLDGRSPGWREDGEADMGRGSGAAPDEGPMSADEAYEILGVAPAASPEDIRRAHRELMMKLHPDRGGSTYLAAKINEAKELLIGRHSRRS